MRAFVRHPAAPTRPGGLTVTAGTGTASLAWRDQSEGAASFVVERRSDGAWADVGSVAGTSYEDTLEAGSYQWRVRAVVDGVSSPPTRAVSGAVQAIGVEPFFEDDFDGGQRHESNGFTWSGGRNAAISDDITYAGSHALKFSFGPEEPDGSSHWWTEQRFSLGRQMTEVWVEYMMYYPDGTEGFGSASFAHRDGPSSDNNKFFRLWGGGHSEYGGNTNKVGMSTRPAGGTGPDGVIFFEYSENNGGTGPGSGPGSRAWEDERGVWTQVRMHYRHTSAPGADDGRFTLWKNGQVWIDFPNVNQSWNADFPYWDSGYILGYDNSGFDATTFIYVDAIKFYDTDPGWSTD